MSNNSSNNSNNTKNDSISFPSPGIEKSFPLLAADGGLMVRHGSSLCLMSQVCEFLANPVQDDSFNYVDPTKDHHKWARRGMQLYYAAVVDPSSPDTIQCALRAATEGILVDDEEEESPTQQQQDATNKKRKQSTLARRKRFLIDYVYTAPAYRDKGIAGLLVRHVLELAQQQQDATCYVLSIEESCVYWMEKHQFFLCQSPGLNQLLNLFPDTHLLKKKKKKEEKKQANDSEDDDDDDSDEEDALLRVQEQGLSSSSSSDSSDDSNSSTATQTPPESFQQPLALLLTTTSQQQQTPNATGSLALCLSTLAVLIRNAMQADAAAASSTSEQQDEGDKKKDDPRKRCKVRINNPQVHKRVFSFGQDAAMQILQACGFDLEVDDEGDAILHFHASANRASWLPAAIAHLELEANKTRK